MNLIFFNELSDAELALVVWLIIAILWAIVAQVWKLLWRFGESSKIKLPPNIEVILSNAWRSKVNFPILMYGWWYANEIYFHESLHSIVELGEWISWANYIIDSKLQKFNLSRNVFKDKDYDFEYEIPSKTEDTSFDVIKDSFAESVSRADDESSLYYYWVIESIKDAQSMEDLIWILREEL